MKKDSWYQGSRSEIIAEYLLSNIAFTVPVIARSDIGVDLFCTLYSIGKDKINRNLAPTSTFTIQLKSKNNDIVLSESNVDYLRVLEVPYFIGVVDRENQSLTIFSCQQFMHIFQKFGGLKRSERFEIKIVPVEEYSEENVKNNLHKIISNKYPEFENLLSDTQNILVKRSSDDDSIPCISLEIGPKIVSINADKINAQDVRDEITKKLSEWITHGYENKYKEKTYVPFHDIRLFGGETHPIKYYHEMNYENNIYPHLAIRLAMLFEHFSRNPQRLKQNEEVIKNSEELVKLTLNKIEGHDYHQILKENFNKIIGRYENKDADLLS